MTNGWCDWSFAAGRQQCATRAIRTIKEGQALGVHHFIVSIDFLLWDQQGLERAGAFDDLRAFVQSLRDSSLLPAIDSVYPLDEPNTRIGGGAAQVPTFAKLRDFLAGAEDTRHIELFAIYAPIRYGTIGMTLFDQIGIDDYDRGTGVFDEYAAIPPGKRVWVVPGGAAPWQQDPAPYKQYADAHPEVVGIMPFLWIDRDDAAGIRNARTRTSYVELGCSIKGCS